MARWVEIRAWQVRVGAPFFVDLSLLQHSTYLGFRSVYAYSDSVKAQIEAGGVTSGLTQTPVYSDTLFLDFDNTDPSETLLWLYDEGYAHTAWHSGNRSVHIHIPLEPMEGAWVPHSQKCWVRDNVPGADLTFYHQAGQFRLPNTRHSKTGRRKILERELYGKRLTIPQVERPTPTYTYVSPQASGSDFIGWLLRTQREPGRRVFVWQLAKIAKENGVPYDVALSHILWWNANRCSPALEEHVVVDRVTGVYKDRRP